jgi:hypothetical protein
LKAFWRNLENASSRGFSNVTDFVLGHPNIGQRNNEFLWADAIEAFGPGDRSAGASSGCQLLCGRLKVKRRNLRNAAFK